MERCALALMAAVHSTTASGCQHARESAAERYLPATSSDFKLSKQHMDAMSVRVRARACVCVPGGDQQGLWAPLFFMQRSCMSVDSTIHYCITRFHGNKMLADALAEIVATHMSRLHSRQTWAQIRPCTGTAPSAVRDRCSVLPLLSCGVCAPAPPACRLRAETPAEEEDGCRAREQCCAGPCAGC